MSVLAFKKKWETIKTRAWPALGVLLILPGASGALGGALEEHRAIGADLTVSYQADTHLDQPTSWSVLVTAPLKSSGRFSLGLDKSVLEHFTIQKIEPAPHTVKERGNETL